MVDRLFSKYTYGIRSTNTRITHPTFVASLAHVDDDCEEVEEVSLLNRSYRIYSSFEFHQVGDQTIMLGRRQYVQQYKEHCASIVDWANLTAEDRDMAFCLPAVLGSLHRADLGDPHYDQLRRVAVFTHQWNRARLRRPDRVQPLDRHYPLLLDLQHRLSSRRGREIWVRCDGKMVEASVVDFTAPPSGIFELKYCFPRQQPCTIRFSDLADLKSQGVEFKNEVADNDVIAETAFVF